MHERQCLCAWIPRLTVETRLALVMHRGEVHKTTATGPLAVAALTESQIYVHGRRDAPLDLCHLHDGGRRVLVLFPAEGARTLSRSLKAEDPRPITLVVPDGNWRQAGRIPKRVPGLERAELVALPPGRPSRWGVRRETREAGLATFEAIARALGILESAEVEEQLEALFSRMVEATLTARGQDSSVPKGDDGISRAEGCHARREELSILHLDDHLVAINKPSGLLVHRGWARDGVPALQRLRDQLGRYVYPVHRLDRATSGVLVFALSSEVARDLQRLFEVGAIQKRYLAVCRGHDPDLRRVDHPLAKTKGAEKRPAVTDFRLLGQFERYGLFEAFPRTGRTHQIRRHLKHASHPIIGDTEYGKGEHNRLFRERFQFHHLALHCHRLTFEHPRGQGPITIEAPLTKELGALLARMGLLDAVG
jgi:tRNA pseudouridine65 synthase